MLFDHEHNMGEIPLGKTTNLAASFLLPCLRWRRIGGACRTAGIFFLGGILFRFPVISKRTKMYENCSSIISSFVTNSHKQRKYLFSRSMLFATFLLCAGEKTTNFRCPWRRSKQQSGGRSLRVVCMQAAEEGRLKQTNRWW